MRPTSRLPFLAATLCLVVVGCDEPAGETDEGEPTPADSAAAAGRDAEPVPEPAAPVPDPPAEPDPVPDGYAGGLRERLRRGQADAVRIASPPGLLAAVGAIRRALARVEPDERAAALAAVSSLAEIAGTKADFLTTTEAVGQGWTPGVRVPGWAAPVLRAVAAGPASAGDPAALTDAELLDGTVAVLLDDPVFRAGLHAWTVVNDVPAVPPEPDVGDDGVEEDVIGVVELAGPGGGRAVIPVVASGGRWVPVIVEATLPAWAARADAAGGTGAAAVLAAAAPHLAAAAEAESQEGFDNAVRAATAAALALSGGPPAPVREDEEVALLLTRPLTARQVADLLLVLEAATDAPARAASEAAPRTGGPGWRVDVGPIADPAAWAARVPALEGAEVDGRTITVAYEPPNADGEAATESRDREGAQ